MASSNDYLVYVLELLREVDGISYKKMMGEYILYKDGKIFGGIYDNRFLVKKVNGLEKYHMREQIPYPTGKAMLLIDSEDSEEIRDIISIVIGH
jgi:hypothetical protein